MTPESKRHTLVSETRQITAWLERAAGDQCLKAAVPGLCLRFTIEVQHEEAVQHVDVGEGPDDVRQGIRFSAPSWVWRRVMAAVPPPKYQAFTALRRLVAEFHVVGSELTIAQSLGGIERLFELARTSQSDVNARAVESSLPEALSAVSGHYCRLQTERDEAVIFYEESGNGPPLLMLHTAGADSRQYLDLLADPQLQAQWHMYAFDLPFHGRSQPTRSWDGTAYSLRQNDYLEWCVQFIETIVNAPVVVMGCSMGAAIAIVLAASKSSWVEGVVALEAPDRSPGRLNPYLHHCAVNQSLHNPAYVRGLMSPTSPPRAKDLACWYYSQGGPGIYSGDLEFYSTEYDGALAARAIDTRECPVFFLTGEYDYSSPPAATKRLANLIAGSHMEIMPGLGHFPMTEDPNTFRLAVRPILGRLRRMVTSQ